MASTDLKMLSLIDDRKRHSELLNRLNIMRKSRAFCDVTVIVENKEFMAHRVILASSSDYFLSKFTEDDNCDRVCLNMRKDIFNLLLEYFYTSNLLVSQENVPHIFAAAKYLKVRRVVKVCEQFLSNNLTVENAIEIRKSIISNENEALCNAVESFIKLNMKSILELNRMCSLKFDIIVEALPKKASEFPLAELVVDWLECALTVDNMKLSDFTDEKIVLFLTPSNSLIQTNEVKSDNSSTFIKDYLQNFINGQKNINKKFKSRPRSRERDHRHSLTSALHKKMQHHQYENTSPIRSSGVVRSDSGAGSGSSVGDNITTSISSSSQEQVIMVSSDEPDNSVDIANASLGNQECSDNAKTPTHHNQNYIGDINTFEQQSINMEGGQISIEYQATNQHTSTSSYNGSAGSDLNSIDDLNCPSDYDAISTSIKSKSSGDADTESCVLAVQAEKYESNDTNASTNTQTESSGINRIRFLSKVCGQMICGSLHVRSVVDMINQGLQETGDDVSMLIVQQLHNHNQTPNGNNYYNGINHPQIGNNNFGQVGINNGYYSGSVGGDSSGLSSSNISAASSQLHIDTICNMCGDDATNTNSVGPNGVGQGQNSVTGINNDHHQSSLASDDQLQLFQQILKKVSQNCSLDPLARMASSRCAAGLVPLSNNRLMVIGGFNRGECLNSTEIYHPSTNEWSHSSSLTTNRARLVTLTTDPYNTSSHPALICAIGGSDGHRELNSVERYDTVTETWSYFNRMKQSRYHHGGCLYQPSAGYTGQFVVVGGLEGPNSLRSTEIFDNTRNEWHELTPLLTARNQAAVASIGNQIFVAGGSDSWRCFNTCEVIDPREGKWYSIPELNHSRRGADMVAHNGHLYLFGGSDGTSSLKSMEIFDPAANQWVISQQSMKQPRVNVVGSNFLFTHRGNNSSSNWLVALGGYTGKHFLDTMEICNLEMISSHAMDSTDEWSMTWPAQWKLPESRKYSECETTITSGNNNELARQAHLLHEQLSQNTKL